MSIEHNELLAIAQEECAEVIQAISKIMRFGLDTVYKDECNKDHLEEEIGDLMCMLEIMQESNIIDWANVSLASARKRKKLAQWSNVLGE